MKNLKTVIALFMLSQTICKAQTQFKNCTDNTLLQNVIVNNATTKEWIGNTDEQGMLTIPDDVSEIETSHPTFGLITMANTKGTICTDESGDVLAELVIDTGASVTKALLEVLDHSFDTYKKANKGKKHYQIDFKLTEQKQPLETFTGILALGNVFNSSFNNYTIKWTEAVKDNKSFNKLPRYQYIAHVSEIFFAEKKNFDKLKKQIQSSTVQRIGNQYYISEKGSNEFITIDADSQTKLVTAYVNTQFLTANKQYAFEKNDRQTMGKVAINFKTAANDYFVEDLSVEAKYLIDQKNYETESFIKQKKMTKDEEKKLEGKGVVGFAMDYVKQLDAYLNSLK